MEIVQIVHHNMSAERPGAIIPTSWLTPKCSRVEAGHLQGSHRRQTLLDGMPQDTVHVAIVNQGGGVAVIAAQNEMARSRCFSVMALTPSATSCQANCTAAWLHALADAFTASSGRVPFMVILWPAAAKRERPARDPVWHSARQ